MNKWTITRIKTEFFKWSGCDKYTSLFIETDMTEHTLTFLFLKVQNIKRDIKLNGKKLLWDIKKK